jgi:hypothetical protein
VDGTERVAPACADAFEKLEACLKTLGCLAVDPTIGDGRDGGCRLRCSTNATSFDVECRGNSGRVSCGCPREAGAPRTFTLDHCQVSPATAATQLIERVCLDGNRRPLGWSAERRR